LDFLVAAIPPMGGDWIVCGDDRFFTVFPPTPSNRASPFAYVCRPIVIVTLQLDRIAAVRHESPAVASLGIIQCCGAALSTFGMKRALFADSFTVESC